MKSNRSHSEEVKDLVTTGGDDAKEKLLQRYKDKETLDTVSDEMKVSFPQLKVCQDKSESVEDDLAKAGDFWDDEAEKVYKAPITVTPLFIFTNRLRWDADLSNKVPLCRSRDAVTGTGDPGGECMRCPERKVWVKDEKKDRNVLEGTCDEQTTIILYIWDSQSVLMLNLARTKNKIAKQIIKLIQASKLPSFCCAFKFNTMKETSLGGKKYHNIFLDTFSNNDKIAILSDKKYTEKVKGFEKLHDEYREQWKKNLIETESERAPSPPSESPADEVLRDKDGNEIF